MDPERARIQADLSGQLEGEVRCDATFLQMYASDASIYEIEPLGVVRPAGTDDVVACVKYAEENDISLIPRGGGSNVAGACVGKGLILDFSYSMRRTHSVGRDMVTVQPGVVLGDLNRQLKPHGHFFAPDPSTRNVTTMGGTLAMNNLGSHWISYGSPRDSVLKLKVVVGNGEVVELDSSKNVAATNATPQLRAQLYAGRVNRILSKNKDLIEESRPDAKVNHAGYNLFDLQRSDQTDLTRLFVGSEGTLGIIVEAVLSTRALPKHRGVACVAACDLLDRRLLSLARETNSEFQRLIPVDAEAMLLVEFQAVDNKTLRSKLDHLITRIQKRKKLTYDACIATQQQQRDLYWRIVRRVVPTLYRLRGDRRAVPFVEDIGINPTKLPEFLQSVHKTLNDNEITASIFSHTPQGTVHIHPFLNLSDKEEVAKMHRLANQLFDKVLEFDGTVSGSHGDGLSRTWFLRRQYGKLFNVFSNVKAIFDPKSVFNPGKIVDHPYYGLADNIRPVIVSKQFLVPQIHNGESPDGPRSISQQSTNRIVLPDSARQTNLTQFERESGTSEALSIGSPQAKAKRPILSSLPVLDAKL